VRGKQGNRVYDVYKQNQTHREGKLSRKKQVHRPMTDSSLPKVVGHEKRADFESLLHLPSIFGFLSLSLSALVVSANALFSASI